MLAGDVRRRTEIVRACSPQAADMADHRSSRRVIEVLPSMRPACFNSNYLRRSTRLVVICVVVGSIVCGWATRAVAEEVSFRRDVVAVLSKAGCNLGTCHGNFNGKNGFKLSLRGQDPAADWRFLTHDQFGRRTNRLEPEQSLILLKATAAVPHEGGRRFDQDSPEYETLHRWIVAGAPDDGDEAAQLVELVASPADNILIEPVDEVQLSVTATFADGSSRDVTRMAVYEPATDAVTVSIDGHVRRDQGGETSIAVRYLEHQALVRVALVPERAGWKWQDVPAANAIDEHVFAKLRRLRMQPSERTGDSEFLRRAYLDALGVLPTVDETRAFLADTADDKRSRLVDRLLERPEFADYWALKWSDLLRNEEKQLDRKGVQAFHHWIREWIEQDRPWNEFARELIAARGSTYHEPATNFYRGNRDPETAAETAAQVFLGVRLQCARCHNHPFDRWSQADYYSFGAFFARVRYKILENNRRDRFDKHEFDGEQIVWHAAQGEVKDPQTGRPAVPRFLGSSSPALDDDGDRLEALAAWIAGPENRLFARMQANRIWYHLMGRGVVDPIDDFRSTNPPINAPLLEALTDEFVRHGYRLKPLVRMIMNSHIYQLSAVPNETNVDDERNFVRAVVRPLEAEPLLDAISQVTAVSAKFNGYPLGMRAGELPGIEAVRKRDRAPSDGDQFLSTFGKPTRSLTCECERSDDTTLGQAFQIISGPLVNELLAAPDSRLATMLAEERSAAEMVDELYLAALCRPPGEQELARLTSYIDESTDRRAALEDILWGLISSKEFLLRN